MGQPRPRVVTVASSVSLVLVKTRGSAVQGLWKSRSVAIVASRRELVHRVVAGAAGPNVQGAECVLQETRSSRIAASAGVRTGCVRACAVGPIGSHVKTPVSATTGKWKPRLELDAGTVALK